MNSTKLQIEKLYREEFGRLVARLMRITGDLDLAEEAVQDAFTVAITHWEKDGFPDKPPAWLMTTARNKVFDRLQKRKTRREVGVSTEIEDDSMNAKRNDLHWDTSISDDRLRLIFMCCHPSLNRQAQISLILKTIGGLTTEEIAHAFLLEVSTLAQRLVRAKQKIREANIPFRIPADSQLPDRIATVLAVVYLIFNEGYAATSGDHHIRHELCNEAIRLGRLLVKLMSDEPEVIGLLSLLILQHSRSDARLDEWGRIILLEDQNREKWKSDEIHDGQKLIERALRMRRPGPYQIQASIAAVHADAHSPEETDWLQILSLYDELLKFQPTPIVELNRAVAVYKIHGVEEALNLLEEIREKGDLQKYLYFHSTFAEFYRETGRIAEAEKSLSTALSLVENDAEKRLLQKRLKNLLSEKK